MGYQYECFFDYELKDWIQAGSLDFRLGAVYDRKKLHEFFDEKKMFEFIKNQRDTVLYAHNFGGFDGLLFLEGVEKFENDPSYQAIVTGGKMIILKDLRRNNMFVDTYALLKGSLRQLEKDFLGEESKGYFDPAMPDRECMDYCGNDCVVLSKIVDAFRDIMKREFGIEPSITTASTAHSVWRTMCFDTVRETEYGELLREYYYGGRVEVFQTEENIYSQIAVLDVNSMYPAMMQVADCPIGRPKVLTDFHKLTVEGGDFYDVTVNIPRDLFVGPLPYGHMGKLYFPTGKFRSIFSGYELKGLEKYITNIHSRLSYRKKKIFSEFVERLYALRRNAELHGEKAISLTAKIMLNSLYGKFAQLPDKQFCFIGEAPKKFLDLNPFECSFGKHTRFEGVYREHWRDSNVAISATITAMARRFLYEHLSGVAPEKLYYCDTDSVHCAASEVDGKFCVSSTKALGEWTHEGVYDKGEYLAPKMYRLSRREEDGTEKIKKAHKGFANYPTIEAEERETVVGVRTFLSTARFEGVVRKRRMLEPDPKRCYDASLSRPWDVSELPNK